MNYLLDCYAKIMNNMKSEKGQALVEYALILVLIAIVVVAMVTGIGTGANTTFSTINSALN